MLLLLRLDVRSEVEFVFGVLGLYRAHRDSSLRCNPGDLGGALAPELSEAEA